MTKITIQHLTFGFAGTAPLFEHVDLNLDTTWKLGLVGRNGRGKTTLLQLLLHHYPYQGTISNPLISQYFPAAVTDPHQPLRSGQPPSHRHLLATAATRVYRGQS